MTSGLDRLEGFVLGALAYLTLSGIWIYGVLDSGVLDGREVVGWTAVGVVMLAGGRGPAHRGRAWAQSARRRTAADRG